jgi:hypothetical protein
MSGPSQLHGCTIASNHYRAHARVLGESFLEHHPGSSFSVLLIDESAAWEPDERFELLTPLDLGLDRPELHRRATMYLTQGLATSLKPDLLRMLLAREGGPVLFLDADTCVYGDLRHLAAAAGEHSLMLSPHSLDIQPLAREGGAEEVFLRSGVINGGLIGVGPGAEAFLDWWAQRTARHCILDQSRVLLFEQTWLTLAPALFPHCILRDRGCNVAGWNLHGRDVVWQGATPSISGVPLRHFHFAAGYDPEHPGRLTAQPHAVWWPALEDRPGVARLSSDYAGRLLAHGHRETCSGPEAYTLMPGGAALEPWMRDCYRAALLDAEEQGTALPPDPFTDGQEPLLAWFERRALAEVEHAAAGQRRAAVDDGEDAPAVDGQTRELMLAMVDTRKLLVRIEELGRDRAQTVAWAERLGAELASAAEAIADRDGDIAELSMQLQQSEQVMQAVWRSFSWRATRPLRRIKAAAERRRPMDGMPLPAAGEGSERLAEPAGQALRALEDPGELLAGLD